MKVSLKVVDDARRQAGKQVGRQTGRFIKDERYVALARINCDMGKCLWPGKSCCDYCVRYVSIV